MDYQNRAGSKKGTGGLLSEAQDNLSRKKQVDNLLRDGDKIPYTFQQDGTDDEKVRKNPYIYKNHSGKLVCKLCNTMHMSWSSVERHINGKKHALNVVRRGNLLEKHSSTHGVVKTREEVQFRNDVESRRKLIKNNGLLPTLKTAIVQDKKTQKLGLAIQVDYTFSEEDNKVDSYDNETLMPVIRIVSGIELSEDDKKDKKYLVIAYEPFENAAVEIPSDQEIVLNQTDIQHDAVDELNEKCTFWDSSSRKFYVQVFFE